MIIRLTPILGIAAMIGVCLILSKNRKAALRRWQLIAWGLGLQLAFAMAILRTAPGQKFFHALNNAFMKVIDCSLAGSQFVFGEQLTDAQAGLGFIAFNVLPTIIFFSALTAVLYQAGVLQVAVKAIAWLMARTMKTSGAETLSASANIFLGMTEAPLMIRPFIPKMTNSELMTVMVGGFATIAGGVLAAYVAVLGGVLEGVAGHLMAASVMSAPAALMFGKLIIPETETPQTLGSVDVPMEKRYDGLIDALAGGAGEGVRLALNVGGMLIAFLAMIALCNIALGWIGGLIMLPFSDAGFVSAGGLTLERIAGYAFAPLALLMGVPWAESLAAGQLMGIKIITNEFVAYLQFQEMAAQFSPRTRIILAYALCGFANLGSIGIQIGGLAIMAPERRSDLARLSLPAMLAGAFAANSTACIAAILIAEE